MKAAERAALMGLADSWWPKDAPGPRTDVCAGFAWCADELRALVAEFEREDGDG